MGTPKKIPLNLGIPHIAVDGAKATQEGLGAPMAGRRPLIMENQMEKKMDNEMETGVI